MTTPEERDFIGEVIRCKRGCIMTSKPKDVRVSRVGASGKYDEVLKPFTQMMEKELHANSGKGDRPGWLSMPADTCLLEIYYHLGKLQKAVKDGSGDGICEYAADVANLSMMLTDICGALALFAAGQPADQQGETVVWSFCPECGSPEIRHQQGKHKQCDDCHQEWFSDIDYSEVVRGNLYRLYRHAQPATAKVDERVAFKEWYAGYEERREKNGWMPLEHSQVTRMFDAWQVRAKLNGGQS